MADVPASPRDALLIEAHRLIRDAATKAVEQLGHASSNATVTYPPEPVLSNTETRALNALDVSQETRAALQKVVANACATTLFNFLCLIDGVADPELVPVEDWFGLDLVEPSDDADRAMLHDDFYEFYWRYKDLTGAA